MVTVENLTDVVAITWEFGANGYTAMNLMGAWFKRRCTARGGDAARRRPSGGRELFTEKVIFSMEKPAILNIAGR